jgi:hypothetical protein
MSDWKPIETAPPYRVPVEIETWDGRRFMAALQPDASMREDETPCDQWQACEGEVYPECWSDGACWESNADHQMSDPPKRWRAAPNHTGGEDA